MQENSGYKNINNRNNIQKVNQYKLKEKESTIKKIKKNIL